MSVSKPKGSYAVMSQTATAVDDLSFFPTPPWATRALMHHVIKTEFRAPTVWEPACGDGAMARVLSEYFGTVHSSDIHDYGFGRVGDFLDIRLWWNLFPDNCPDSIITNPPFNLALDFAKTALPIAGSGVALLVRSNWIEGVERGKFFDAHPFTYFAPFTERVPMVKGRLDRKASTATSYAWFVWDKRWPDLETVRRIPPCRKSLDRDEDWPVLP